MVRADASIWISWILPRSTLLIRVNGRIMSPKVSPTEIASRLPSRSFGRFERRIGERDHAHRRAGLVEGDDLDRQALAHRLRGGDRGPIAELLVAARQQLEHVLRAVAFGELHVEAFGLVVALLQGDVERRILALELPGEPHRQLFRRLRERRLQRRGRKRDRETCHACDNGTQPQRCRSHGLTSPCPGGLLLAP